MSILNVNKINPVGGGSTITIAGIASVTGSVTATGTITGEHHGDGSNLTGISAGTSLSGSTNNTVCTVTGANAIQGEANLTFDGSILNINAGVPSLKLTDSDGGPCFHEIKGPGNGDLRLSCDVGNTSSSGSEIQFLIHDAEKAIITSDGDLKFNSGYGSAGTAYGVRAWIAFKATGNANVTRGSGNATMTDHGTGDFTMNFTTAMPDTGYSMVGTAGHNSGVIVLGLTGGGTGSSPTTTGFRFSVRANYNNSSLMDEEYINLIVVR